MKQKHYNICEILPILSVLCLLAGTILSVMPQILDWGDNAGSWIRIWWIPIFIVGLAFGGLFNALQQYTLNLYKLNKEEPSPAGEVLNMLAYGCFSQLITLLALFWVDIIPWFGGSTMDSFKNDTLHEVKCLFHMVPDYCTNTWWYALMFISGYITTYIASALLNKTSATYSSLTTTLVAPITLIFWLIVPKFNPNGAVPPLWSIIPSFILLVVGVVIWKIWELRSDKKRRNTEPVKSHEQIN